MLIGVVALSVCMAEFGVDLDLKAGCDDHYRLNTSEIEFVLIYLLVIMVAEWAKELMMN